MFADEVPPRDVLFIFFARNRKRTHAGIGLENAVAREPGARQSQIRLGKQIVDFPKFAPDLIRVTFKANVGGSNQIEFIPRNDKDGPTITARLQINSIAPARREMEPQ